MKKNILNTVRGRFALLSGTMILILLIIQCTTSFEVKLPILILSIFAVSISYVLTSIEKMLEKEL